MAGILLVLSQKPGLSGLHDPPLYHPGASLPSHEREQALVYEQTGIASHYNECALWGLVSGKTAIGENVRPWHLHAAHPTLPLPCEVLVQSLRTGKTVKVRVNDRGPFIKNRIIDLSEEAAERLDMKHHGLDKVRITVLSVGDGKWKKEAPPCATPA